MIDRMVQESRNKRAQMAQEKTFEPIAIDFGFEDSVAFDSDYNQVNSDGQQCGEDFCDRASDSSKASAIRGHANNEEESNEANEAIKNALNEQCGLLSNNAARFGITWIFK